MFATRREFNKNRTSFRNEEKFFQDCYRQVGAEEREHARAVRREVVALVRLAGAGVGSSGVFSWHQDSSASGPVSGDPRGGPAAEPTLDERGLAGTVGA